MPLMGTPGGQADTVYCTQEKQKKCMVAHGYLGILIQMTKKGIYIIWKMSEKTNLCLVQSVLKMARVHAECLNADTEYHI